MCTTAQLDFFRIVLELCGYTEIFLSGGIKYNIYKFHTMGAFISIASFPTLGFITRSNAKLACDFNTRAKLCVCYDTVSALDSWYTISFPYFSSCTSLFSLFISAIRSGLSSTIGSIRSAASAIPSSISCRLTSILFSLFVIVALGLVSRCLLDDKVSIGYRG